MRVPKAIWLVLLAGCSTGVPGSGAPSSDTTFSRAARVSEPMLSCAEATNSAIQAVRTMGYTVTEVKRASPEQPGLVIGTRELGFAAADPVSHGHNTMQVRVTCSDSGSSFEAVSDEEGLSSFNFPSRFSSIVKKDVSTKKVRTTRPAEEARGLIVNMEPARADAAVSAFGADLPGAGVIPVRIDINNRSDRRYDFAQDQVTMVTTQGKREKPLSPEAAAKLAGSAELAAKMREKAVAEGEIAPGATRGGYLYFRASTYGSARVMLMDIESEEPEGFSISF